MEDMNTDEEERNIDLEDRSTDEVFTTGQVIGMFTIVLHPQADNADFDEFMTTTAAAAIKPGVWNRAGTRIDGSELYLHIADPDAPEYLWLLSFSGMDLVRSEEDPAGFRLAIGQRSLEQAFEDVKDQIEEYGTCTSRRFFIAPQRE